MPGDGLHVAVTGCTGDATLRGTPGYAYSNEKALVER